MKKVYVAHPFQGKKSNKESITHICRLLSTMGIIPISPVHAFSYLNDNIPEERAKAMEYCDSLIEVVDAVFLCGAWESSEGCCRERDAALMLMKPVYIVSGWKDGVPLFRGASPKWFNYKRKGGN